MNETAAQAVTIDPLLENSQEKIAPHGRARGRNAAPQVPAPVFQRDTATGRKCPGSKHASTRQSKSDPVGLWTVPAGIVKNNFKFKSLSNWAFNPAVGCAHGCRFCYVPGVSVDKQASRLAAYGVTDPDAQWGEYLLIRPWDEREFLASLKRAETTAVEALKPDGNRAVIYSSTTDPYQVIHHPEAARREELSQHLRWVTRRSLELIRDGSTLNVRILTRSPLARRDFELFRSFGHRLLFGMSLPTLRNDLARVYEPTVPSPTQRLAALQAAKDAGLNVFVAMAPTYPDCDEADLRQTLRAIGALNPVTIFHEPINVRADNVARIQKRAEELNTVIRTGVFATAQSWQDYAVTALQTVERIAREEGLSDRLHLWPDQSLGTKAALRRRPDRSEFEAWLGKCWSRVSEWPKPE